MGKIKVLDPQTINEIAAGEVIERPASVVKELIENSIDSGAKRIIVGVENGGKKKIEVIDDGEGMCRDDAVLAIRQHATSKLSRIEDLSLLSSYGFRGEALASIAAVSKISIRTRCKEEPSGVMLSSEFGSSPDVQSIGAPIGTSVIVEEVFGNVPARRKNLSSEKTEYSHICDVFTKYAVAWPEISFDLISNGANIMGFRGPDRITRVAELIGTKAAKRIVEFAKTTIDLEISGALTMMDVTRSSPSSIYLYINHRPVSSQILLSAIADAYGTRLMKGQYPLGYLMVNISPNEIDVNVHPTKREVRFVDPKKVKESVLHAIDEAFRGTDTTPQLGDIMDYMKVGETTKRIEPAKSKPTAQDRIEIEAVEEKGTAPLMPLFQLFNTYIVAKSSDEESIVIIDQHAAAERITYEKILRSLKNGKNISQRLLSPSLLDLSSSEKPFFKIISRIFVLWDFEIEEFGGGSYRLVDVPVVLGAEQGEQALKLIIDDISKSSRRRPVGEEIIWKVACHGSIRANEELSLSQMSSIISGLFKTENPYTCEHGRPTMISLKPVDFERLFKRRL